MFDRDKAESGARLMTQALQLLDMIDEPEAAVHLSLALELLRVRLGECEVQPV